ncbi:hypothetical protein [Streptomyces sp. NPDC002746]
MRELIAFITMHLLPPTAAFAAWNEYRNRRRSMLVVTLVGSATAGSGLLLDQPGLGLIGLLLLCPPVIAMRRDFRDDYQ